jgi:hypothetical protein
VDANGLVTPMDVLLIINYLNLDAAGLSTDSTVDAALYMDTNGDGIVSPLDVLLVVNALNTGQGGVAEGEAGRTPTSDAPIHFDLLPDAPSNAGSAPESAPSFASSSLTSPRPALATAAAIEPGDARTSAADGMPAWCEPCNAGEQPTRLPSPSAPGGQRPSTWHDVEETIDEFAEEVARTWL